MILRYNKAVKPYKGKVLFIMVDIDVEDNVNVLEYFGGKIADVPIIKILAERNKYTSVAEELTVDTISSFVQSFLDGRLKPYYKSEEIPEDWDKEPVKVIVAKNFREVAMNPDKDVFVEFCKFHYIIIHLSMLKCKSKFISAILY